MEEQLNSLIQLQQIDKSIQELLSASEDNPRKMRQIEQEIQEVQEGLKAFIQEMEDLKKQRKSLEKEIEICDQKIKKSQIKLMEVKTNKEYRAMLTETDDLKKGKSGKEDLLLELLEKLEEGVQKEKILKKNVEATTTEGQRKKDQLEKERQTYEKEFLEINQKREKLTSRIESPLLKQYEFLKDRLKGVAVAEVKDATCLSCHMQIPPQLYNELHRKDKIIPCPSCLRILYLAGLDGGEKA
jgi:predicted  nucleic acid-binding Zn-ribbon protein